MCWAGCCRWNWWAADNNAKRISNEATAAIIWQFAESRCGRGDSWVDGAWIDFWGYHSKATEAAYQSGAKSFQFQDDHGGLITVVFGKGGYHGDDDEHYQYSGNGTYRRVRRVKILMQ